MTDRDRQPDDTTAPTGEPVVSKPYIMPDDPEPGSVELLQKEGAEVKYNDAYFAFVGRGRKYDLQMHNTPLENLDQYDCVVILTDHSDYDYEQIAREARLVVDTRNATRGIRADNIVRC